MEIIPPPDKILHSKHIQLEIYLSMSEHAHTATPAQDDLAVLPIAYVKCQIYE